jgi:DNA-directed RNA polymerase beta subunit
MSTSKKKSSSSRSSKKEEEPPPPPPARVRDAVGPSYALDSLPRNLSKLRELTQPHIESFDYFLDSALHIAVKDIPAVEVTLGDDNKTNLCWWLESVSVEHPTKGDGSVSSSKSLTPRECRERGMSYGAPMVGTFRYKVDGGADHVITRPLGVSETSERTNKRTNGPTNEYE